MTIFATMASSEYTDIITPLQKHFRRIIRHIVSFYKIPLPFAKHTPSFRTSVNKLGGESKPIITTCPSIYSSSNLTPPSEKEEDKLGLMSYWWIVDPHLLISLFRASL